MTRTLSDNFKEAVFSQQTREVFITLVTISHPSFTDDIRIADDPFELLPTAGVRGVVSRGDEYIFMPFNLTLPTQDDSGVVKANISIDNISREIVAAARNADSALAVKVEIVLSSDPDTVEMVFDEFIFDRVSYDALTVSGNLSMEYFELEPFPSKRITPSLFEGIF